MTHTTEVGIGRRDFARVALGGFGAAAIQATRDCAQKATGTRALLNRAHPEVQL